MSNESHPDMSYTTHVISLGAGVQSTVMLLMACEGILTPRPAAAIFADTGWEPSDVYQHLDWLETVSDIPIIRTSNGRNLYDDTWNGVSYSDRPFRDIPAYVWTAANKPRLARRHCTRNYKITPIAHAVRQLIGRQSASRSEFPRAVQWIGISQDEWHRQKPSGRSWVDNRWPLLEIGFTRVDCSNWFNSHYPGRPLVKSSCVGCPFHSDREWLRLYREQPEDIARTIALDEQMRADGQEYHKGFTRAEFLHRKCIPLRQVLEKLDRDDRAGQQLAMLDGFGNECEGHCGV